MSSSPWFPMVMCKAVGGKVLTASFISDPKAQGGGEAGPHGGQLELSLKKKKKKEGREKKSLYKNNLSEPIGKFARPEDTVG